MRFAGPVMNGPLKGQRLEHSAPFYRMHERKELSKEAFDFNADIKEINIELITYIFDKGAGVWRLEK